MTHYIFLDSPIGKLTAVSKDGYLTELCFGATELPDAVFTSDEVLQDTAHWLKQYFHGEQPSLTIPLNPHGTDFQKSVWSLLGQIPYGQSVTYGSLASQLENPRMSAQAVGQAVGRNPIPILIPCHRVLGAGKMLTGYAGGLDKKRFLLELEQIEYR